MKLKSEYKAAPTPSRRQKKKRGKAPRYRLVMLISLLILLIISIWFLIRGNGTSEHTSKVTAVDSTELTGQSNGGQEKQPTDNVIVQNDTKPNQEDAIEKLVQERMRTMTLDEKIGQLLFVDYESIHAEHPNMQQVKALEQLQPGGVILFRSQLMTMKSAVAETAKLHQLNSPIPVWIGIDQEGGLVSRLPFLPEMNGNMALAATGDTKWTMQTAERIGQQLDQLGFHVNFAPVADVNRNPDNSVIGIRSFGSEPERIAQHVSAFIDGLQSAQIPAAVKHFPGHGDTNIDSHSDLPVLKHTEEQLKKVDWIPFTHAVEAGADMVMTAHVSVPSLDDTVVKSSKSGKTIHMPATLSSRILNKLRSDLKFEGLIVTDAMNMTAIQKHFSSEEASLRALQAGVDVLLMPPEPSKVKQYIKTSVMKGKLSKNRIDESVARILRVKAKYGLLEPERKLLSTEERLSEVASWAKQNGDRAFTREVAEEAVTFEGDDKLFPILSDKRNKIVLIGTDQVALERMKKALFDEMGVTAAKKKQKSGNSGSLQVRTERIAPLKSLKDAKEQANRILGKLEKDEAILVVSSNAKLQKGQQQSLQAVLSTLQAGNRQAGLLVTQLPYDSQVLDGSSYVLYTYGNLQPNLQAAASMLSRTTEEVKQSRGKLPVDLN